MQLPSHTEQLRLADLSIDEDLWGPDSTETVVGWLRDNYDPLTMPTLVCSTLKGREGIWLMGWRHEGTHFPGLLPLIFGQEYADRQIARVNADTALRERLKEHGEYGQGKGHA
jgi:hypothetical protein